MKLSTKILFLALVLLAAPVVAVESRRVPLLMNYQGSLTDEGGNPLPDGETTIKFRVLEPGGATLFEEEQTVEVVDGRISAMVGNGIDASTGAPSGGLPPDALDPSDMRYLQAEVKGHDPYDRLLIVSSPYAIYADTAFRVADGAVASEMIAAGAIRKEHLSDELMSAVFPQGIPRELLPKETVFEDEFKGFRDVIQSGDGASHVGVSSAFIFSGAQTVEGVLRDIDTAVKKRQEEILFVDGKNIDRAGDAMAGTLQFTGGGEQLKGGGWAITDGGAATVSSLSAASADISSMNSPNISGGLIQTTGRHDGSWQGYNPGNASGDIPVNNGAVSEGLNADLIDGYHYDNIPSYMRAPVIVKKGFVTIKFKGGWCKYEDSDGAGGDCPSVNKTSVFDVVQVIRSKATAFADEGAIQTEDEPHILHVGSDAVYTLLPSPDYEVVPPLRMEYSVSGPMVRLIKDDPENRDIKTGRMDTIIRMNFIVERLGVASIADFNFTVNYTVYGLDM